MPDELPKLMDELLRRHARTRRQQAGPPFELHPADRQLLQEEARRLYGRRQGWLPAFWRTWQWSWVPRLATVCGLFVLLAMAIYSVLYQGGGSGGASHQLIAMQKAPQGTVARQQEALVGQAPPAMVAREAGTEATPRPPTPGGQPSAPVEVKASQQLAAAVTGEVKSAPAVAAVAAPAPGLQGEKAAPESTPVNSDKGNEKQHSSPAEPMVAMRKAEARMMRGAPPTAEAPVPGRPLAAKASASAAGGASVAVTPAVMGLVDLYYSGQQRNAQDLDNMRRAVPAPAQAAVHEAEKQRARFSLADGAGVEKGGEVRQQYVVVNPEQSAQPLAAFQVVLTNSQLHIVDADGSVYQGAVVVLESAASTADAAPSRGQVRGAESLRMASPAQTLRSANQTGPVAAADRLASLPPVQQFEVRGTNQRLGRAVVITGVFTQAPPAGLQLQLKVGDGKPQTFQARPLEK